MTFIKTLLLLTLLLISSGAQSIGERVRTGDEIHGCWKRVIYSKETMAQMNSHDFYDPELQKYQWYCFEADNTFRVMTSSRDQDYTAKQLRTIYKDLPAPMSWKWVQDSVVWVGHKDDSTMNSNWIVRHIREDMRVFGGNLIPKDSLFMAIPTHDLSSFVTVRVLKRLTD